MGDLTKVVLDIVTLRKRELEKSKLEMNTSFLPYPFHQLGNTVDFFFFCLIYINFMPSPTLWFDLVQALHFFPGLFQ